MKRRSRIERLKELVLYERRLGRSGYRLIAGIDEAGRGPLAGPVVASAVILKDFDFKEDIDDSKRLSPRKRERACKEILKKAIVGIGVVDEKTIDEINIYRATMRAMELALSRLKVQPDYALVDGRIKLATRCPIRCIPQGDSKSLSIACASIVAKVTRDRIMMRYDSLYPQYGFSRHKGYPTKFHKIALKKSGPSPIHRYTFQPVKELELK